ncbi:branched chain amino acid/phenylalanine ABC transporter ATP binding subunit LivF [Rhodovastum atsumiense]|uniref:ABC transporter ATP-binding protein n=1 Tax=Rhodovastum atsumiense TaxID=504468 RepID=UPI00193B8DE7|nr:ABC transporter ATP-binding protein [Rhodovastum atsumiense]CAH2599743.1 branched chain amino acid/phenylalanine ABC transporter ATP binding subunit LivF [Rhodovastum atsumiense]
MAPDLIRFEDVSAGYGALTILDHLSATVRAGEITLLIGPNGAGKSTVLKTFFGLVKPSAGRILFQDEEVGGLSPAALLRRGIAFVPQGRNLFPSLSVAHNLELGAVTLPRALRAERCAEALARFPGFAERIRNQASTLSGGEQKQLEIARALLLRPEVLLIDEPSIGLSPIVSRDVFRLLRSLADAGTTVLMVEQNVRSALAIADRVLLLEGGRVVLDSPAAALLDDPDLNRVFLGRAVGAG